MFGIARKFPGDPWAELLYNLERRMGDALVERLRACGFELSVRREA